MFGQVSGNPSRPGQILVRHTYGHDDMEASRGPGRLGAWIRLTGKANWRVARVDLGLNMASAVILGSVTWHTSNVSVIDMVCLVVQITYYLAS